MLDLVPEFLRFRRGEISEDYYLASRPSFFEHYFQYWARKGAFDLSTSEDTLASRAEFIRRSIKNASDILNQNGIDRRDISALLFVGVGAANGHAFYDGELFAAWFAIETFPHEQSAKVFAMHELLHAIHYTRSPEFYFADEASKNLLWRQLIVEGVATYLTQILLGISEEEALWGGYLSSEDTDAWIMSCAKAERSLTQFALSTYETSDETIQLFYADEESDVFSNRGGYYLGRAIIEQIAIEEGLSPLDLLSMPAAGLKSLTLEHLKQHITHNF